jgi:hypothetical protein
MRYFTSSTAAVPFVRVQAGSSQWRAVDGASGGGASVRVWGLRSGPFSGAAIDDVLSLLAACWGHAVRRAAEGCNNGYRRLAVPGMLVLDLVAAGSTNRFPSTMQTI